jgi:hypothetical protein
VFAKGGEMTPLKELEPGYLLPAYASNEADLRIQYLQLDESQPDTASSQIIPKDLVERTAVLLEVFAVGACLIEALADIGKPLNALTTEEGERLLQHVQEVSGLDAIRAARDAQRILHRPHRKVHPQSITLTAVAKAARALLDVCPIDAVERLAADNGFEEWGHRCRVAYDVLRAFVYRADPRTASAMRVMGQAYVEGRLSMVEITTLLDSQTSDVVADLERLGYHRPVSTIVLQTDQRDVMLARAKEERLGRRGLPAPSDEMIAREVIASERIESVDARRWISRDQSPAPRR